MSKFLCAMVGFSGGLAVGGGIAAFFSALGVVTRLIMLCGTEKYHKLYPISILLGSLCSTLAYFLDIQLNTSKVLLIFVGCLMGVFVGMVASALAEVIDVIPVLSKRLGLVHWIYAIILAMVFGKVCGSLLFWLVPNFYK